jgi:type I restriction enzyme, S subunit
MMDELRGYPAYKDSSIEWFDRVPSDWNKKKIGWLFGLIASGTTPPSDDINFYNGHIPWLNTGDLNDGVITKTTKSVTELALQDYSTLKMYPANSLVMAMYGATIGKLGITRIETTTNQACCVMSVPLNIDNRFIFYWFLANRKEIINLSQGGGQPNINQNIIKGLRLYVPNIEKQYKISDFLDEKTSEIDSLITDKEKMIKLLEEKRQAMITEAVTKGLNPDVKMKDSGVEWIGTIPEDWEIKRLKYSVSLRTEKASDNSSLIYVGLENIESKSGKFVSTVLSGEQEIEGSAIVFYSGDVLFGKLRPYLVKCILADFDGQCTTEALVFSVNSSFLINEYLKYIMLSHAFIDVVNSSTYGAKMPRASWDFIGNLKIPLPNVEEQTAIINNIKKQTNNIDELIEDLTSQIQKLKQYRQSLIYEAVTGKIDVQAYNKVTS